MHSPRVSLERIDEVPRGPQRIRDALLPHAVAGGTRERPPARRTDVNCVPRPPQRAHDGERGPFVAIRHEDRDPHPTPVTIGSAGSPPPPSAGHSVSLPPSSSPEPGPEPALPR